MDKALFLGWYPREKLVYFYKIADIFVFSSTTETQGLVTLEAMAGGCAVVAVEAPGTISLVENGKEGLLAQEDYNDFYQKVLYLLNNESLLHNMKNNAIKKATQFSIMESAKKLEELYKEIIKNKEKNKKIIEK